MTTFSKLNVENDAKDFFMMVKRIYNLQALKGFYVPPKV